MKSVGLTKSIHYIEYMGQEDLNLLYASADFNLSFASCETFGRAIVESLSTGLPNVILDENGDMMTVIGDNHGSIFCSSVVAMADAIVSLHKDELLYAKLEADAVKFGAKYKEDNIHQLLANTILEG